MKNSIKLIVFVALMSISCYFQMYTEVAGTEAGNDCTVVSTESLQNESTNAGLGFDDEEEKAIKRFVAYRRHIVADLYNKYDYVVVTLNI